MRYLKTISLLLLIFGLTACEDPKKAQEKQAIVQYFTELYDWAALIGQQNPANIEEVGVLHSKAVESLHHLADKHLTIAQQHQYTELKLAAMLMTDAITEVYAQQAELLEELNPRWPTLEHMLVALQDVAQYRDEHARLDRLYNRVDKFERGLLAMREDVRQNIQNSGLSEPNRIFVWQNVESLFIPILQKNSFYNVSILRKVKERQSVVQFIHDNRQEFWLNKKSGLIETKQFSSFLQTLMERLNNPRP